MKETLTGPLVQANDKAQSGAPRRSALEVQDLWKFKMDEADGWVREGGGSKDSGPEQEGGP